MATNDSGLSGEEQFRAYQWAVDHHWEKELVDDQIVARMPYPEIEFTDLQIHLPKYIVAALREAAEEEDGEGHGESGGPGGGFDGFMWVLLEDYLRDRCELKDSMTNGAS